MITQVTPGTGRRSRQERLGAGRDLVRRIISLFRDTGADGIESEDVVSLVRSAMPAIDPNAVALPHLPPSVDFRLITEVIGWDKPLQENERHVPALAEQALWVDTADFL